MKSGRILDTIRITKGLRGGAMSPLLFIHIMDEIIKECENKMVELDIGI